MDIDRDTHTDKDKQRNRQTGKRRECGERDNRTCLDEGPASVEKYFAARQKNAFYRYNQKLISLVSTASATGNSCSSSGKEHPSPHPHSLPHPPSILVSSIYHRRPSRAVADGGQPGSISAYP